MPRNGNDARERIINAASDLFQTYGYSAVGLNAIVDASGAPKGSLYYYFPGGKEELALESVRLAGERICQDIANSMGREGSLPHVFSEHALDLAKRLSSGGKHFSLTLLALEAMHVNEDIRSACCTTFDRMIALYEGKLLAGGFEPALARSTAIAVQCIIDNAITLSVLNGDVRYLEAAASQLQRLV